METFDLATSNRMDMTKKYVLSYIDITPMSIKYRLTEVSQVNKYQLACL